MRLRTKALIIIGLTLIGLVAISVLVTRWILLDRFEELERMDTVQKVKQAHLAMLEATVALDTLASDYAGWDDTYEFINGKSRDAYLESNLVDATFLDTRLNMMLFINLRGEVDYGKTVDLDTESETTNLDELARLCAVYPILLEHDDPTSSHKGLVLIDGRPMLVSSNPILTSLKTGPIRGSLIMGRFLGREIKDKLRSTTLLDVDVFPVADVDGNVEVAGALERLRENAGRPFAEPLDHRRVAGYRLVTDLADQPLLLLRVTSQRQIYHRGQDSLIYVITALVIAGIVFGGVTMLLLERVILRRVSRLSTRVSRIGEKGEPTARVVVHGSDEISELAVAINEMLEAVERSRGALQYVGQHARCILWSAEVVEIPHGRLRWDLHMQDEQAAQRLLPLDIFHGGSYAAAWKRSRHKEDYERAEETAATGIRDGQPSYSHEFRVRTKDGEDHWISEDVDIESAGARTWRLVGVCTDITARKHAEEQLQQARDAAIQVSRMKSAFLANMSHEIRTPMNGIVGMTDLMLDTRLTDEQREYLEMVRGSADTLLDVINDILDFSKIEAGRLELEVAPFRLRSWLSDAINLQAVRAQQKGLELFAHVDPAVPDALEGDPVRLRQILINLVGNAIKFTNVGEIVARVSLDATDADQKMIHFHVSDTGIGIAPEKLRVIFDAFRQADSSTTRKYGGTGLGLAISKELAQRMHGRMWAESRVGGGSTFHFTSLLRVQADAAQSPARPRELRGRRVLIIDDNRTSRQIIEALVSQWGLLPTSAAGAASAHFDLERVRAEGERFEAVLCDASLPESDAFELASELHARDDVGTVIMMINLADRQRDGIRCRRLGLAGYVTRPIRQSELFNALLGSFGAGSEMTRPASSDNAAPADVNRRLSVLLAEDNPVNQKVARRLLEKLGHEVTVVDDGRQAIDRLHDDTFDLLLVDIQMPHLGGMETTQIIREEEANTGRHLPIVAMTAHALKGDRERCIAAGMDGYVAKPITVDALVQEIGRIFEEAPTVGAASQSVDGIGPFHLDQALARLDGDRELLGEMAGLFLEQYPQQLEEIRAAANEGRFDTVGRITHTLKGAVSNFITPDVVEAAVALEAAAEAADPSATAAALEDLRQHLVVLDGGLRSLIEEPSE